MSALLTRMNLYRRRVKTDGVCPMCEQEAESTVHSLLLCDSAGQVWNKWEEYPVILNDNRIDFSEAAMIRILTEGTIQDLELFFCSCLVHLV